MDKILPSIEACPHQQCIPFLFFDHRGEGFIEFDYFRHMFEAVNESGSSIDILSVFLCFVPHAFQINDEEVVQHILIQV